MNALPQIVRTFIAIDVPEGLKEEIGRIQRELAKVGGGKVSWVRPEGIHLTLKFLGDVERNAIDKVIEAVRVVAGRHQDFTIKTTLRGGFPRLNQPKTLWVGVDGGKNLIALRNDLELVMDEINFPTEEGKFHPHLTVGRVKALEMNSPLPTKFLELPLDNFEWRAGRINVMASQLKPTGAEYSVLASATLC